jgi:hypothetical protein
MNSLFEARSYGLTRGVRFSVFIVPVNLKAQVSVLQLYSGWFKSTETAFGLRLE